jgi:hypothetical protein
MQDLSVQTIKDDRGWATIVAQGDAPSSVGTLVDRWGSLESLVVLIVPIDRAAPVLELTQAEKLREAIDKSLVALIQPGDRDSFLVSVPHERVQTLLEEIAAKVATERRE